MTELTDLSDTDASNITVTGNSTQGNVANMGGMDNLQQAILGMLSRFRNANIFRLRDNSDNTKLLAFDLSGLTTGTTRTVAFPDRSGTAALTTDISTRRNRIVNGDMRMSQENGTASGTTTGRYPVDQWAQYFVTSAGTLTVAQVAAVTPAGSPNRLRATVTVADAALAAGEYWTLTQNLEGSNVADLQYGGASAKASVLRFGFKGPAGTYAARVGNSAANRSFVALFTISGGQANTDTVQTIAITGDATGTWLTADGVIGLTLDIVLACGSTFQGATGWQTGLILGTSGVSNGMATGAAVFELFDVGLKIDPDVTGVYGAYEIGPVDAVYRSERYFKQINNSRNATDIVGNGYMFSSINIRVVVEIQIEMAKAPTVAFSGVTHFVVYTPDGTFITTAMALLLAGMKLYLSGTINSASTAYSGMALAFDGTVGRFINLNARLA